MKIFLSINDDTISEGVGSREAMAMGYDGVEYVLPLYQAGKTIKDAKTAISKLVFVKMIFLPFEYHDLHDFEKAIKDNISLASEYDVPAIGLYPLLCHQDAGRREYAEKMIRIIKAMAVENDQVKICYGMHEKPQAKDMGRRYYKKLGAWVIDVLQYDLESVFDTAHAGSYEISFLKNVTLLGSKIKHVHLADFNPRTKAGHMVPGEGSLDLRHFLLSLRAEMPDVTVTLMLDHKLYQGSYKKAASKSIEFVRQVLY